VAFTTKKLIPVLFYNILKVRLIPQLCIPVGMVLRSWA